MTETWALGATPIELWSPDKCRANGGEHEHAPECTCTSGGDCGDPGEAGCCWCNHRDLYAPCPRARIDRDQAISLLNGAGDGEPMSVVPIGEDGEHLVTVGIWPAEDLARWVNEFWDLVRDDKITPAQIHHTWCVMDADPEHDWAIRWGQRHEHDREAFQVTVFESV